MTLAPEGRTELALSGGGCSCCALPTHSAAATGAARDRADAATSGDPGTSSGPAHSGGPAHSAVFAVDGMTCDNCVRHVTEELSAVYGVDSIEVALVAGGVSTVSVTASAPIDDSAIVAAVAEAGYRVVAR